MWCGWMEFVGSAGWINVMHPATHWPLLWPIVPATTNLRSKIRVALSAIDNPAGAGYETCLVARQETHDIGDFFSRSEPAEWKVSADKVFGGILILSEAYIPGASWESD
jgi:hypothetical protein